MPHPLRCAAAAALLCTAQAADRIPSGDHAVAPPYAVDPALTAQGNPAGSFFSFSLQTNASRVFNGSSPTFAGAACHGPTPGECCHKDSPPGPCEVNWERNITLYVPAAYRDGDEAPVLVMQDGPGWLTQVAYALDNLSPATSPDPANRSLPAFIAVSVENGGSDAIKSERGLEYDTMSDRYARFVAEEVLPAALADPAVRRAFPGLAFSADPDRRAAFGCSSGAAASLTMAWFRPDLFRRVAAYSATLVDQQDHADETGAFAHNVLGAWGYHSGPRLIAATRPPRPLRVFHHGSENDLGWDTAAAPANETVAGLNNTAGDPGNWTDGHHNWLVAANRTAAALREAGYAYRHIYSVATGHCDSRVILQTLADTLVWLWYD